MASDEFQKVRTAWAEVCEAWADLWRKDGWAGIWLVMRLSVRKALRQK